MADARHPGAPTRRAPPTTPPCRSAADTCGATAPASPLDRSGESQSSPGWRRLDALTTPGLVPAPPRNSARPLLPLPPLLLLHQTPSPELSKRPALWPGLGPCPVHHPELNPPPTPPDLLAGGGSFGVAELHGDFGSKRSTRRVGPAGPAWEAAAGPGPSDAWPAVAGTRLGGQCPTCSRERRPGGAQARLGGRGTGCRWARPRGPCYFLVLGFAYCAGRAGK